MHAHIQSLEKHTLIQTKIGQDFTRVFRPKRHTNRTLWGGTYVAYKANIKEHYPTEA